MTNEYATKVLKRIQYGTTYPVYEALDMAIEALNFVSEHHQSNIETYAHDMGVSLEQAERELRVEELSCSEEPNRSDLINRSDAVNAIYHHLTGWTMDECRMMLHEVPSAQPEIIKCKDCKHYQGEDSWFHCNRVTWLNGEDDFCSRGE